MLRARLLRAKNKQWFATLSSRNGKQIWKTSETYMRIKDAQHALDFLFRFRSEINKTKRGRYVAQLFARNGEEIWNTGNRYKSRASAQHAINLLQRGYVMP